MYESKISINTTRGRTEEARAGTSKEAVGVKSSWSKKTFIYLETDCALTHRTINSFLQVTWIRHSDFIMTKCLNWLFLTEGIYSKFTIVPKNHWRKISAVLRIWQRLYSIYELDFLSHLKSLS